MNNREKNLAGLQGLIDNFSVLEKAVINYKQRHERLLKDMQADPAFDPMDCLPGLMYVQHDLENALSKARMDHVLKKVLVQNGMSEIRLKKTIEDALWFVEPENVYNIAYKLFKDYEKDKETKPDMLRSFLCWCVDKMQGQLPTTKVVGLHLTPEDTRSRVSLPIDAIGPLTGAL